MEGRIKAKTPPSRVPSNTPMSVLNNLEEGGQSVAVVALSTRLTS